MVTPIPGGPDRPPPPVETSRVMPRPPGGIGGNGGVVLVVVSGTLGIGCTAVVDDCPVVMVVAPRVVVVVVCRADVVVLNDVVVVVVTAVVVVVVSAPTPASALWRLIPLWTMMADPAWSATVRGLKTTTIVHGAPGPTTSPVLQDPPVNWNSPVTLTVRTVTEASLAKMSVWAALTWPTVTEPKFRLDGERVCVDGPVVDVWAPAPAAPTAARSAAMTPVVANRALIAVTPPPSPPQAPDYARHPGNR